MQSLRTTLFRYGLFLSVFCLAHGANAISITLDNPNQTVAAPASGFTTLTFSGTVTLDPAFAALEPFIDNPFNASQTNFLVATVDSTFSAAITTGLGTSYTGTLFTVSVPTGTLADLYAFNFVDNPSVLTVLEYTAGGSTGEATAPFSVLVTGGNPNPGGNGVPESGSGVLLLGLSVTGLLFVRRVAKQS